MASENKNPPIISLNDVNKSPLPGMFFPFKKPNDWSFIPLLQWLLTKTITAPQTSATSYIMTEPLPWSVGNMPCVFFCKG